MSISNVGTTSMDRDEDIISRNLGWHDRKVAWIRKRLFLTRDIGRLRSGERRRLPASQNNSVMSSQDHVFS